MAALAEKACTPFEADGHRTGNSEPGHAVGVCNEARKQPKAAPTAHRGLEQPATTLPTCCPRYPPGSTLLECRLEGDQPVAHVVQVPGDGNVATQKTCLLVETKQTEFGPLSRVLARTQEDPNAQDCSEPLTSYCLEARECPADGPVATIALVPVDCTSGSSNMFTTLETITDGSNLDKPSSKITYGPVNSDTSSPSFYKDARHELPLTTIDCTTFKDQTVARVTKCSTADTSETKRFYETCVPRNGQPPIATGFFSPQDQSSPCHHNLLETKIDQCGPRACRVSCPREDSQYCCYMQAKPGNDGPMAIMRQELDDNAVNMFSMGQVQGSKEDYRSAICAGSKQSRQNRLDAMIKDDPGASKRRNGLDSSDMKVQAPVRKGRRAVCPVRCCKPTDNKPKSCFFPLEEQKNQTEANSPAKFKCVLVPYSVLEQMEDKLGRGQTREPERRKDTCTSERKTKDRREDFMPTVRSEELVTRYREYVPPYMLSRYETCRSKRNGLQDECELPVPRAVLELKRKEMMRQNEIERIDGPDDRCVY